VRGGLCPSKFMCMCCAAHEFAGSGAPGQRPARSANSPLADEELCI
jgi:hypothetical protein